MSAVNLTIRFACEVSAVAAVVWWGWPVLGIVLGLVAIGVWAAVVAPKAARRLPDPARFAVELVIFACATAAFVAVGHAIVAAAFAVLAVVTAGLVRVWPEPVDRA